MYNHVAAVLLLTFLCQTAAFAQSPSAPPAAKTPEVNSKRVTYETKQAIVYNEAAPTKCVLDLYYPLSQKDFATVVWFHGGGLTGGKRSIPEDLKENGIAVVAVDYRLYPNVKSPTYVEDAAAAVAWTFENIAEFGGSREKIFVSGHSAGGYLTSMIGLDKHYLDAHGIDANKIAGLIPFSGHTITHFTVREERGIKDTQVIVDEMAPIFHARADAPPT
jgi:acetyl esterase/lipase